MKIVDLLGGEAEYYLNHTCKTIDKQLIHIPGPDMIDKVWMNSDRNIRVLGMKDFVNPQADLFAASSHGLSVLSCIGMNQPGIMIGTAPEASFWLFRSEDEASEHLVCLLYTSLYIGIAYKQTY